MVIDNNYIDIINIDKSYELIKLLLWRRYRGTEARRHRGTKATRGRK